MSRKTIKLTCYIILILFLSIVTVNILEPAFHKPVSESYQSTVRETGFTSDSPCDEQILCIDDNEEALLWRLRMIGSAKESIILTTFDLRADNSGTDIMSALYAAAERDVKVKLLIDGIYLPFFLGKNDTFLALISHDNVEARFYNALQPSNLYRLNYRMHDKYLIIDEKMYLLGGRNTNDIFLGNYTEGINYDRDILVYSTASTPGSSLTDLLSYFSDIWDEPCVKKNTGITKKEGFADEYAALNAHYESLKKQHEDIDNYDGWLETTYAVDKITLINNGIAASGKAPQLLYTIEQLCLTGKDVLIQTPYVICNADMYRTLERITANANVKIILNTVERGSNPWGCTDYLNNKQKILDTGVDVYELMNDAAVHTKTILVDDNISIIGSYNLDMRSTYLDTELMLVIDSEKLNTHIREMSQEYILKSKEVLSDGTEREGAFYEQTELSGGQKVIYAILKVITRPFRHLL